jgi:hypothetical protein
MEQDPLLHPKHKTHEILRWVPVMGLAVSFYSALFATFVLYPWHIELSNEFSDLKRAFNSSL